MARCDHAAWIELWQGEAGPLLNHGWRLPQIVKELPNAFEQSPQITLFLGRHLKDRALRTLCQNNYKGRKGKNNVNIRIDNRTINALHPQLFADSDPTNLKLQPMQPAIAGSIRCHQDHTISMDRLPLDFEVYDIVLTRLLFMFVDVICIFVDDVGGPDAVHSMLSNWIRIGLASTLPRSIRPKVIIVTGSNITQSVTSDLLDETDFFFELQTLHPDLFDVFSDISFSQLPSDKLSSKAQFLTLHADISKQLHKARFNRIKHNLMFSAPHLSDLFKIATRHIGEPSPPRFDFIVAARQQNPLDGAFSSHLMEFLKTSGKATLPYDGIASHIASAIMIDAYPFGAHCLSLHIDFVSPCHKLTLR